MVPCASLSELADEPSTGIGRVGVVPRPSLPWPMNPLQGSGVSERSRCGAVRILAMADEPSTRIGRVGALSLWCRAHPAVDR